MNILYIGDIMGEPGMIAAKEVLPILRKEGSIDLVLAQAENVTEGKGLSVKDFTELKDIGVDFCTGGNWTMFREEIVPLLEDPSSPVVRPANYPKGTRGQEWKYILTPQGKVLVVSLLGKIVGKDADVPVDNPLQTIDRILEENKGIKRAATIVNFHGDYSSEKRIIGYYLDGRVTAVIGDHWHVPTADAAVLPKGTAHITDVGMCGSLHSSLGVELESVIPRWREGKVTPNTLATERPYQFSAVLIAVNDQTGLTSSITHIHQMLR